MKGPFPEPLELQHWHQMSGETRQNYIITTLFSALFWTACHHDFEKDMQLITKLHQNLTEVRDCSCWDGEEVTCSSSCTTSLQGELCAFVKAVLKERMSSPTRTSWSHCSQITQRMVRAFPSQPYELTVKQRKPSIFWLMHTNHSHSRAGHCSLCSSRLSELKFQANDFHTVKTWKPCNLRDAKNPDFHFMTISTKPFLWVIAIVLLSKHRLRRIYMYLNIILSSAPLPPPHLERIILQGKWQPFDSHKTTRNQDCQ